MNTFLSSLYLKLNQIDARYIRLAFIALSIFAIGGRIMGLPINGDVSN